MGFRQFLEPLNLLIFTFYVLSVGSLIFANGQSTGTKPFSVTPINHDLYHASGALIEEIESLVHRHPDKVSTFGQHARELISSELALRLLSILSQEEFLPNFNRSTLRRTLHQLVIKVVPLENQQGRKLVEDGELCERRNGRGVDLKRNWSVDWGKKEKDYDPYEENPGTAPFSEPETQVMRKLSVSFEPHIWVNVHSGWKYLAHGTATDYMYDVARVPMAFTFEIYGDPKASSKDCFKMFNPTDITTFNGVLNDWSAASLHMFSIGRHHIDGLQSKIIGSSFDNWVSIDDYLNGYLMQRKSRYGKKIEVLDLGLQEIRMYFRLFLLSSVLLLFMFCSRISKSTRPLVATIPL